MVDTWSPNLWIPTLKCYLLTSCFLTKTFHRLMNAKRTTQKKTRNLYTIKMIVSKGLLKWIASRQSLIVGLHGAFPMVTWPGMRAGNYENIGIFRPSWMIWHIYWMLARNVVPTGKELELLYCLDIWTLVWEKDNQAWVTQTLRKHNDPNLEPIL